jgi:hypothetical protein
LAYPVGKYDTFTGEPIKKHFLIVPGATGLAVTDATVVYQRGILFVASINGTVGEYDAKTGDAINKNFITGLEGPSGIAVKNVGVKRK